MMFSFFFIHLCQPNEKQSHENNTSKRQHGIVEVSVVCSYFPPFLLTKTCARNVTYYCIYEYFVHILRKRVYLLVYL
jgi:hypothetical protein